MEYKWRVKMPDQAQMVNVALDHRRNMRGLPTFIIQVKPTALHALRSQITQASRTPQDQLFHRKVRLAPVRHTIRSATLEAYDDYITKACEIR